jgi:hypothetical protein
VYTSWDRFLFKGGDSLEDALENTLVFGRGRPAEIASMEQRETLRGGRAARSRGRAWQ